MTRNRLWTDEAIQGIKDNLIAQIDKIWDNTNEKGIKTRARYYEATERYCGFLADNYKTVKLSNTNGKQFNAYANHLVEKGYSGSYVRNELSGIRFYHKRSGSKYTLPENDKLSVELPSKNSGTIDRGWTDGEVTAARILAKEVGRGDIDAGISLARAFGLRLEEVALMRVEQLEKALDRYELELFKGQAKGGQERVIPVTNDTQIATIKNSIAYAKGEGRHGYDKVISRSGKGGVEAQKVSMQNFMHNHREKIQENFREKENDQFDQMKRFCEERGFKMRTENLTWHGLRYSYANERYNDLYNGYRNQGISHENADRWACKTVSRELGHYRESITRLYLSSK